MQSGMRILLYAVERSSTIPATSIRIALKAVSRVAVPDARPLVPDPLALPAKPKLKINSRAPKTNPLTPASESIRLLASEKQWIAPKEQIRLTPKTTIEVIVKLVRVVLMRAADVDG